MTSKGDELDENTGEDEDLRVITTLSEALAAIFGMVPEHEVHPHVDEERAALFHSLGGGATELEYLTLIHAIAHVEKPQLVLETGAYKGIGSLALAAALSVNGFGMLHSLEIDPQRIEDARANIRAFDPLLLEMVTFHETDSLEWLEAYEGPPFQMAFFDSELHLRHRELEIMLRRSLLDTGAIAIFHDTSRHRGRYSDDYSAEMIRALDDYSSGRQWMEFPLSRGLRMVRVS